MLVSRRIRTRPSSGTNGVVEPFLRIHRPKIHGGGSGRKDDSASRNEKRNADDKGAKERRLRPERKEQVGEKEGRGRGEEGEKGRKREGTQCLSGETAVTNSGLEPERGTVARG